MLLCGLVGAAGGGSLSVDGSDAEKRLYMDWLFFCLLGWIKAKVNNSNIIPWSW